LPNVILTNEAKQITTILLLLNYYIVLGLFFGYTTNFYS